MIRVTFDRDYISNLEDYYQRNECIREQQYLSQEKLMHLAAFCTSRVAIIVDESGGARWNDQKAEAALDVVRQLSLLCGRAIRADVSIEPITIVNGQAIDERESHERHTTPTATPTFVAIGRRNLRTLWAATGSIVCAVAGWHTIQGKRPVVD